MTADTTQAGMLKTEDRRVLTELFSIDLRSLAVVRIALAVIVLIEASGVVTSGLDTGIAAGWGRVVIVPFAVMLLLGVRTRIATIACWLIYALAVRKGLLEAGGVHMGSYVASQILFWSMFLPLGGRWSLDSRSGAPELPSRYLSVASAALLIQVFLIYFTAGVSKNFGEWILDPIALETILGYPDHGSALGQAATQYPLVLAAASIGAVALEIIGPVVMFVPGKSLQVRRTILVAAFTAFHVGMALLMELETFPYLMMGVWIVFLPTSIWDRLPRRESTPDATAATRIDRSRVRNGLAALALAFITVSNFLTLAYYPYDGGFPEAYQTVAKEVVLYQQWLMFSAPSSLG